ncbi:MAG: FprA family A-type flavoprotein [Eubacteriaceae bacterium]|nr:FprA family A-type flavoprotein [Eubacteriaceae bacterium]
MKITSDILYAGVHDRDIDLFESQYVVPGGISYNSYVITDEKCAVVDTVDSRFGEEWMKNVRECLCGRKPDYLIVQHMEPDHSANIITFADEYPDAVLVGTAKTFTMIANFFGRDMGSRALSVKDGDTLSLGKHELTFVTAPMVHWPEVMLTCDSTDRVLFSADAFGRFGDPDESLPWTDEARRYYIGIVGKYGAQVQTLLKKASSLAIEKICPLHGPVLKEDLGYYIGLYDTWSSYRPEEEGVLIAYTSVYGHTAEAAKLLGKMLEGFGVMTAVYDLARCDMSQAVAQAFRYDRLVLATTTYNGDIFPFMRQFIENLTERNFRARKVGLIENGSWGPQGVKVMKALMEGAKDLEFCGTEVRILSALNGESRAALELLAQELR